MKSYSTDVHCQLVQAYQRRSQRALADAFGVSPSLRTITMMRNIAGIHGWMLCYCTSFMPWRWVVRAIVFKKKFFETTDLSSLSQCGW